MARRLSTLFLPELSDSRELADSTVVVTDVLRATSTIVTALDQGAAKVIPAAEIDEALRLKGELGPECVLGGERGGVIIDGFDRGNSPLEFTPDVIAGRTLVLCTTNGTRAMARCREAAQIFIAAFVNLSKTAEALSQYESISIVCSGTDRRVTSEDVLFAGALAAKVLEGSSGWQPSDQTVIALGYWTEFCRRANGSEAALADELASGAGGRNLKRLGYDDDIRFCAQIDRVPRLARLDPQIWEII
jgi:2-phosphosulfolactate phosphatase